jgi:drug/metabolite transporter (DMT)-like permease
VSADVGIEPAADQAMPQAARRDQIPLAIVYMVSAGVVFAGSSAVSKWLVATIPIGEVLFTRAVFGLLACSLFILPASGLAVFYTRRPGAHVIRGVSQTCSQSLLLVAFSMMPLAGATAINFSSPLFATLASVIFLKEAVGAARAGALAVGFLGVLIVTSPGADTFQAGAVFALANAVLFGTVTAGVRGMTATESAETLTMFQLTMLSGVYALALSLGFIVPTAREALLMILNGVGNGLAQYWWTRALHMAPTAAVVPFNYLSLVWAVILGFAIWGDTPTLSLLIGSAIVVASGLFLLWHESRRAVVQDDMP